MFDKPRHAVFNLGKKRYLVFYIGMILKLTSHGILHYLWSADLSKSFPQLIILIFILSHYFVLFILQGGKGWGYIITYIVNQ